MTVCTLCAKDMHVYIYVHVQVLECSPVCRTTCMYMTLVPSVCTQAVLCLYICGCAVVCRWVWVCKHAWTCVHTCIYKAVCLCAYIFVQGHVHTFRYVLLHETCVPEVDMVCVHVIYLCAQVCIPVCRYTGHMCVSGCVCMCGSSLNSQELGPLHVWLCAYACVHMPVCTRLRM